MLLLKKYFCYLKGVNILWSNFYFTVYKPGLSAGMSVSSVAY